MEDSIAKHYRAERGLCTTAKIATGSITSVSFDGKGYVPAKYWPQYKTRNWLRFFWWPIMIGLGIIFFAIAVVIGGWAVKYGGLSGIVLSAEFGLIIAIIEWQMYDKWESMPTWFFSDPIRMRSAEIESVKREDSNFATI